MSTNDPIKLLEMLFEKTGVTDQNVKDYWLNKVKSMDNPIFNALIDTFNKNIAGVTRLQNIFDQVDCNLSIKFLKSVRSLIVLHPTDATLLRVFPNLVISSVSSVEELKNVSVFDAPDIFKDFMKQYEEDLAIEHKKVAWEPLDRAIERLNRFVDMKTSAALARYVEWDLKDAALDTFATNIDGYRKPIEIRFAVTPQDFTIMYGSGPSSCMSADASRMANWPELASVGMCPPSFYSYFPFTKGAYAVKGKSVVARAILFTYDDNTVADDKKKWHYGRLYHNNNEYGNKFIESLEQQGITNLEKKGNYTEHRLFTPPKGLQFKIPGIKYGERWYMPWPYFDNMEYYGKGFYASFDNDTKEFEITYNGKEGIGMVPINNQQGRLVSTDYIEQKCAFCGTKIPRGQAISSHDGKLFCGDNSHISQAGYIIVINANGNEGWHLPNHHFVQSTDGKTYFTTYAAAARYNYYPVISDGDALPEEGSTVKVSQRGYKYGDMQGNTYISEYKYEGPLARIEHDIKGQKVVEFIPNDIIGNIIDLEPTEKDVGAQAGLLPAEQEVVKAGDFDVLWLDDDLLPDEEAPLPRI